MAADTVSKPLYVSLGDSISIDDYAGGPGCGAASLLFENRDTDFPQWRGRDLRSRLPGADFVLLARDGATSETVRDVQIPWLEDRRVRPEIVTITMGGNDLLQVFGDDESALAAYETFLQNGDDVLKGLRALTGPEARILIGTIYDPSDGGGDPRQLHMEPWPTALEWIRKFNAEIAALAARYGAELIDIHAAFQLDPLTQQLRDAAWPRRGIGERAWPGLCQIQIFLHGVRTHAGVRHHHQR